MALKNVNSEKFILLTFSQVKKPYFWKEETLDGWTLHVVYYRSIPTRYMPVYLGETATAKWALTFRMWWSFSHGTFSPRKGKQLCCSLGFPPGLHFQLLVNIAIWLQLFPWWFDLWFLPFSAQWDYILFQVAFLFSRICICISRRTLISRYCWFYL